MFASSTSARKHTPSSRSVVAPEVAGSNPPVITVPEVHPVYGKTPMGRDGFVLERQVIQMINHWHKRAGDYLDEMPAGAGDKWLPIVRVEQGKLFDAALAYKPRRGRDASAQFAVIAREMRTEGTIQILDVDAFEVLTSGLIEATQPVQPKKMPGSGSRGKKLTRSGLLQRYQAFLINELMTLGVVLYGSRDYALNHAFGDDAVDARCTSPASRDPFFNEKQLPGRARLVLKSLKIDIVNAGER